MIDERLAAKADGSGLLGCSPSEDGELWVPYLEKVRISHTHCLAMAIKHCASGTPCGLSCSHCSGGQALAVHCGGWDKIDGGQCTHVRIRDAVCCSWQFASIAQAGMLAAGLVAADRLQRPIHDPTQQGDRQFPVLRKVQPKR